MIGGTTPTHLFNLPFKVDIIDKVRVVYSQNDDPVLVKTNEHCTLEDKQIEVTLSQEDTFKFDRKLPVEIQVRILTTTNAALASIPKSVGITKCLEHGVII